MAFLLTVIRAQVDGLIGADNTELPALRRDRLIRSAVEELSRDKPNTETDDVTGDAGRYYILSGGTSVVDNWVDGFSRVAQIEYPAATVASDESPVYLDPEDWRDDYWASDVRYLYLPNHAPAATEKARVTYTVPWLWTASTVTTAVSQVAHGLLLNDYAYLDTTWLKANDQRIATHKVSAVATVDACTVAELQANIDVTDFFALGYLGASLCCQAIADKYARIGDSTISVDSAAHASKSAEFARRAAELRKLYRSALGLDASNETRTKGAGAFVDWNTAPGWPTGRRYVYHQGR